jgi:formylglycine-generating enzyme required for sulfatase activity
VTDEQPLRGARVGAERDDNRLTLRLVWCPPGSFRMGSLRSEPWRQEDENRVGVTLTEGFWLGKYEVTQAEWQQLMRSSPWRGLEFGESGPRLPAANISWDGVWEFVARNPGSNLVRRGGGGWGGCARSRPSDLRATTKPTRSLKSWAGE